MIFSKLSEGLRCNLTAFFIFSLIVVGYACGNNNDQQVDIDATVEAKVQEQLATEATIEAQVQKRLLSQQPTQTPVPPATQIPVPPATQIPVPTSTSTPITNLPSSISVLQRSKSVIGLTSSYQYQGEVALQAGDFNLPFIVTGYYQVPNIQKQQLEMSFMGLALTQEFLEIDGKSFLKDESPWQESFSYEGFDVMSMLSGDDSLLIMPIAWSPSIDLFNGDETYYIRWNLEEAMKTDNMPTQALSFFNFDDDAPLHAMEL